MCRHTTMVAQLGDYQYWHTVNMALSTWAGVMARFIYSRLTFCVSYAC